MPVRMPGPTCIGSWRKNLRASSSMIGFIGGTTLATMTASMAETAAPAASKSPSRKTPYSSAVRPGSVWSRQLRARRAPE